jgi:toxin-antitoxin system PIN domain toxin
VIILDANILLYAYDLDSRHHQRARQWVEAIFSSPEPVGLTWQSVTAFLRIVTNPRLTGRRFTPEEAVQIVDQWVCQPNVRLLAPGDQHWNLLRELIIQGQTRGPLVSDAHLAALTLEHGGILQTTDRDFTRFPELRHTNPLA